MNCVSYMFRHRMTPDGTLVIRNMEKKDGGVYGCLASNLAGTDTMSSILTYIGEWYSAHTFNWKSTIRNMDCTCDIRSKHLCFHLPSLLRL